MPERPQLAIYLDIIAVVIDQAMPQLTESECVQIESQVRTMADRLAGRLREIRYPWHSQSK